MKTRYDAVAMTLHWAIAAAIISTFALGFSMTGRKPSQAMFELYQLHKSLGLTIFGLSLLRLVWRFVSPPPAALPGKRAERLAAQAAHWAFYGFMLGVPVLGWLMVSASPWNIPTLLWGVLNIPHPPALAGLDPAGKAAAEAVFRDAHKYAAYAMVTLLVLHAAAALRHHFVLRDATLARMTPGLNPDRSAS